MLDKLQGLEAMDRALVTASAQSVGRLWLLIEEPGPVLCPWCEGGNDGHGFKFQEGEFKCGCPCHKENKQ